MTHADGEATLTRATEAYDFVKTQSRWVNAAPLAKLLTFQVVSAASEPHLLGVAIGHDLFRINDTNLANPLSEGTMAHELTHSQDGRELGVRGTDKVPHYFLEGRAISMGKSYRQLKGVPLDMPYDKQQVQALTGLTVEEAHRILTVDVYEPESQMADSFKMEATGTLFIQWEIKRTGPIQERAARMIAKVGAGATFEDAFRSELLVSLPSAIQGFEEFLRATAGRPEERFRDTCFAGVH